MINIGGHEAVGSRKVTFTFVTGDLTRSCVDAQLLIVLSVGLAVVWIGRPIRKDYMAEGLKMQFTFAYGAKGAFPVSLM